VIKRGKCSALSFAKTVGWQKEFDVISYSQIQAGTGIKNRSTISMALHELQGEIPLYRGRRAPDRSVGIETLTRRA
jgi:hypothetical protein